MISHKDTIMKTKLKYIHRLILIDHKYLLSNKTLNQLTDKTGIVFDKSLNCTAGAPVSASEQFEQLKLGLPNLKVISISEDKNTISLYVTV